MHFPRHQLGYLLEHRPSPIREQFHRPSDEELCVQTKEGINTEEASTAIRWSELDAIDIVFVDWCLSGNMFVSRGSARCATLSQKIEPAPTDMRQAFEAIHAVGRHSTTPLPASHNLAWV